MNNTSLLLLLAVGLGYMLLRSNAPSLTAPPVTCPPGQVPTYTFSGNSLFCAPPGTMT